MVELFAFLAANQGSLIGILTSITGIMSIIASMAPVVGTNPYWSFTRQVIDLLAFNFGNAKNQERIKNEETISNTSASS